MTEPLLRSAEGEDIAVAFTALRQFLLQAPVGLVHMASDGVIKMINPQAAQLLRPIACAEERSNLFELLAPVAPQLHRLATLTRPGDGLCEGLRLSVGPPAAPGATPPTLSMSVMRLDDGSLMARITDITQAVQLEHEQQRLAIQLRDVARVDSLTAMPNRTVVLERIEQALACVRADPRDRFAVLFINGDRFNRINITLGPAAGNELLRMMAGRLNGSLRLRDAGSRPGGPEQTAARLGGDEFVVLLGLSGEDEPGVVAQRLIDALCKPYRIGDQAVYATASMGVVLCDAQVGGDADSVLQDASLAMREAKRTGGARYSVFEPAMKERAWRRGSIESELRQGLAAGQLFVAYQPILDLRGGGVTGVEALVRWRHPLRGNVPPVEFIEIAEESGLISAIGQFVLNEACQQFAAWRRELGARAPDVLSVNLSRAQLVECALVDQVRGALAASGLSAGHLQLEITESLAAQDECVQARLHELKALGLTLALDDFGTGYSSLASLHLLPVDVVKIDRSFVSQVESSAHHRVLIEATVRVARSLGMRTVAEGIETAGQAAILAALECDKGQGYLYARPLPGEEATRWLALGPPATVPQPTYPVSAISEPVAGMGPQDKLLHCLGQTQIAIALFDPSERLAYANRAYLALHWEGLDGMPTWEDIMREAHRRRRGVRIDTHDIDNWLACVRRRYRQQPLRTFESDITDGRWMRVTEETRPDGWQLCVSTDVTSLKVNEAALRQARDQAVAASVTDPLTGLPNRRLLHDRLPEMMAEAQALRMPLTVAVIDLDHFKVINDTHGHAAGDEVLVWFATCLAALVRPRDAVARIGGEEFLLVLANTGRQGAERVLGALRASLHTAPARLPLAVPPLALQANFSAGVAEACPGESAEALCQRADQGLYLAKAAGRGRDAFVAAPQAFDPAGAAPTY